MTSLHSLTEKLEVGDKLAWVGDKADPGETVRPKTVTNIDDGGTTIRIDADGFGGGRYFYRIDDAGNSEAFWVKPKDDPRSMGTIIFAELTDSDDRVPFKRGYYDSR